jgi:CTD kinase subunit alpha
MSSVDRFPYLLLDRYLSPTALDLAQKLLEYDPAKRITASDALNTSFFKVEPAAVLPVEYVEVWISGHEVFV